MLQNRTQDNKEQLHMEQVCFQGTPESRHRLGFSQIRREVVPKFGAAAKKDESPTRFLERGTKSRVASDEDLSRYLRSVYLSLCKEIKSTKYDAAAPIMHLKTFRMILNTISP